METSCGIVLYTLISICGFYKFGRYGDRSSVPDVGVMGLVNIHDIVYGATIRFQYCNFGDQETVHDVHVSSTHTQ